MAVSRGTAPQKTGSSRYPRERARATPRVRGRILTRAPASARRCGRWEGRPPGGGLDRSPRQAIRAVHVEAGRSGAANPARPKGSNVTVFLGARPPLKARPSGRRFPFGPRTQLGTPLRHAPASVVPPSRTGLTGAADILKMPRRRHRPPLPSQKRTCHHTLPPYAETAPPGNAISKLFQEYSVIFIPQQMPWHPLSPFTIPYIILCNMILTNMNGNHAHSVYIRKSF
jgi:hypothetical protein